MIESGFGIMPNIILFDKNLNDKQKLLYCFISSLCAEKGYSRATNDYIGKQLNCSGNTISTNISKLIKLGFLNIEISSNYQRKIFLTNNIGVLKNQKGGIEKSKRGGIEKSKDNNINYNNIIEYSQKYLENKKIMSSYLLNIFLDLGYIPSKTETVETFKEWFQNKIINEYNITEYLKIKSVIDAFHTYWKYESNNSIKNFKSTFQNSPILNKLK